MAGYIVPAWILFGALALVLVWMLCGVIAVIVLMQQNRGHSHGKRNVSQRRSRPPIATSKKMRAAVRQISIYTHHEETAARLLHHTRLENRGKPLEWCVEKTIHDLVRDRR